VIEYMDAQIGRIFQRLKAIGEYDNTVIAFTSDQGIAIGSHGLMGKQNLYEHSMRSGLTIAGPGIPRGKKVDAFAYLFDIYPTVCDLVGARIPESLEGKSLAPVIQGKSAGVRDTVMLGYRDFQRAVRHGRWKLIRYPDIDRTQLFDLEADPFEMHDLASRPEQRERITKMLALLRREQERFGDRLPLTAAHPRNGDVNLEFFKQPVVEKK
jgi:arylsulfatase A-like enzyme